MSLVDHLEYQVQFLQGFADKTRLRIIRSLIDDEKTVSQLVAELGCSQANTSAHLKTLKNSGILKSRKEGKFVFYSLRDEKIHDFIMYLDELLLDMRKQKLKSYKSQLRKPGLC